ncbi:hypothetical protein RFI_18097 [Reticulomyxa filosa]|uniref:Uncharacterized protein n=1 Tax=Reticulomyxa filosa TaxID=46433 RepID=X6MYM5_RETFI|nr:hypothetical protein RFI_18097 [Reticulomyxa filosa]|eukprot:ETO19140.1 hypothetical protein RFI_18097 [Reticulomyxa filosa]
MTQVTQSKSLQLHPTLSESPEFLESDRTAAEKEIEAHLVKAKCIEAESDPLRQDYKEVVKCIRSFSPKTCTYLSLLDKIKSAEELWPFIYKELLSSKEAQYKHKIISVIGMNMCVFWKEERERERETNK